MTAGPNIAVIDYGMGNRRSVQKALEHVGARAEITSEHEAIRRADGVVVPGVGAFPLAMERLTASGLGELIIELARHDTPILGICLGMQLLFDRSEELGSTPGLGLIAGEVTGLDTGGQRVPHIGWNEVRFERASILTEGLPSDGAPFYHVHSLAPRPVEAADVVGSTEYGERFATIVSRGSIHGVQFHPEKSSRHGLQMLGNFAAICARRPVSAR
jgi:imidazole glycerol-phosphate synthase subunit HisH